MTLHLKLSAIPSACLLFLLTAPAWSEQERGADFVCENSYENCYINNDSFASLSALALHLNDVFQLSVTLNNGVSCPNNAMTKNGSLEEILMTNFPTCGYLFNFEDDSDSLTSIFVIKNWTDSDKSEKDFLEKDKRRTRKATTKSTKTFVRKSETVDLLSDNLGRSPRFDDGGNIDALSVN